MAKNCSNPICNKLVKWLDRNRCKGCAKYHRRHGIDRTSLDMRKNKPKKEKYKIAKVAYTCIQCGAVENGRRGRSLVCKRCQTNNNSKRYRLNHPERRREITNNYRKTHREAYLATLKRARDKRRNTIKGKLDHRISANMYRGLRNNKAGKSWKEILPYSVDELKNHLEALFINGMSWELLMQGEIEIDHIVPMAHFVYTSTNDEEFKKCWELNNLQPLWKTDNRKKNAKLGWLPASSLYRV